MNLQNRDDFLTYTGVFLTILLAVTIGLATWLEVTPLTRIHWRVLDLGIGVLAALIMMPVFGFISPVRQQAETILGPSLAACRWYDFIIMAALVGLIEELLFRGVLEPWAARWNPTIALIGVNVVFGLLHAVSVPYALVVMVLGSILSLLAYWPGEYNLLRPITAHAVYDYIGFVWIAHSYRRQHQHSRITTTYQPPSPPDEENSEL